MRVALAYRGGEAKGEVILPPLPMGHVHWMQPSWTNAAGETRWAAATPYRITAPPVERKSVQIAYRAPATGIRPVALTETMSFKVPDHPELDFTLRMSSQLTENVYRSGDSGYSVGVSLGRVQFSQQQGKSPRGLTRVTNASPAI